MHLLLAAALAVASISRPAVRQSSDQLPLRAVRFYRDDTSRTRVTRSLDSPSPVARSSGSVYQVDFRISDSTGSTIGAEAWKVTVPAERHAGPGGGETIEFLGTPGRYRLEAAVKNRVTGRESRSALELEAFDHQPGVS